MAEIAKRYTGTIGVTVYFQTLSAPGKHEHQKRESVGNVSMEGPLLGREKVRKSERVCAPHPPGGPGVCQELNGRDDESPSEGRHWRPLRLLRGMVGGSVLSMFEIYVGQDHAEKIYVEVL